MNICLRAADNQCNEPFNKLFQRKTHIDLHLDSLNPTNK